MKFNTAYKFISRNQNIFIPWRTITNHRWIGTHHTIISLCGNAPVIDSITSEINQLHHAKIIRSDNQFIGINQNPDIILAWEQQYPDSKFYCGDWSKIIVKVLSSNNPPSIINLDTTSTILHALPMLSKTMFALNDLTDVFIACNIVAIQTRGGYTKHSQEYIKERLFGTGKYLTKQEIINRSVFQSALELGWKYKGMKSYAGKDGKLMDYMMTWLFYKK